MPASADPAGRAAPPRLGHVPALDGVRGIAVLLVVACHALAVGGGFLGVEIFFVLSGFLITTLLLDERHARGSIGLRSFYARRVRRLYPALAATLAGWLGLAALGIAPRPLGEETIGVLVSGTYVANAAAAWFYALPEGLRHLWSLALEEQSYLLWPPVLVVALNRRVRRAVLVRGLLVAVVGVALLRSGLSLAGRDVIMLYESPATAGGGLLLGCAVALSRAHGLPRLLARPRPLSWLGFAALVFLVALGLRGPGATDRVYYTWLMLLVDAASALLVLSVVSVPRSLVARACALGWLAWVGRISYSLYLVHPIVLVVAVIHHRLLTPANAILVSIILAAALHRFVEQPLRRSRAPHPKPPRGERTATAPA